MLGIMNWFNDYGGFFKYYNYQNKKRKYKPILNIYPNKTYIRDKRNVNYYCRDNC